MDQNEKDGKASEATSAPKSDRKALGATSAQSTVRMAQEATTAGDWPAPSAEENAKDANSPKIFSHRAADGSEDVHNHPNAAAPKLPTEANAYEVKGKNQMQECSIDEE